MSRFLFMSRPIRPDLPSRSSKPQAIQVVVPLGRAPPGRTITPHFGRPRPGPACCDATSPLDALSAVGRIRGAPGDLCVR